MENPDFIVCNFMENSIAPKRVYIQTDVSREARCLNVGLGPQ